MEEPKLSDHQLRVLAEGILRKGYIPVDLIYKLYASDDAAKSAIMSLESWGYVVIDYKTPGYLKVIKAPDEAWIIAEKMKEAREKANLDNSRN